MNPENLVGKAINPDPAKAVIEVSSERAAQEGIYSICKGVMLAFRIRPMTDWWKPCGKLRSTGWSCPRAQADAAESLGSCRAA